MLECKIDILVEWGHCDPARIVYNPNFFDWMEHGLSALFSASGFSLADALAAHPALRGTPLVRSEAEFKGPARVGDTLVLSSKVVRWGRTSFDIAYDFLLDGETIVTAKQTRVWSGVDETGQLRALPIPGEIREALSRSATVSFSTVRQEN